MNLQGPAEDIEKLRQESQGRLKGAWEMILDKYSCDHPDSDVVDLVTGEIVEDKGHLRYAPVTVFGRSSGDEIEESMEDFLTPAVIEPVCWESGDDEPDFKAIYARRRIMKQKKEKDERDERDIIQSTAKPSLGSSPMRVIDMNAISPIDRKGLIRIQIDSIDIQKVIIHFNHSPQA